MLELDICKSQIVGGRVKLQSEFIFSYEENAMTIKINEMEILRLHMPRNLRIKLRKLLRVDLRLGHDLLTVKCE